MGPSSLTLARLNVSFDGQAHAKTSAVAANRLAAKEDDCLRSSAFQKRPQLPAPRWVAQLTERLRFDLADALAGDREALTDLFERVLAAVSHTDAHFDDLLFAGGQRLQDRL